MKKFEVKSLLAMLLALTMLLSFAACGKPAETTAPSDLTDPVGTDPVEINPPETDPPVVTDPVETDPPVVTDPEETDPKYDPIETDPPVTDPIETEPEETKAPETTKKEEETQSPQSGGDHEHVYRSQILVYPGCENEGEMAMVCLYCGDAKDREVIEATGHTYNSVLVDIDSPVYHTANVGVCSVCKEVLGFEKYVDEHTFVSKELVPCVDTTGGYTDYGYEIFVCSDSNCGYTLYVGANAADGHYYVADEGSGKLYCRCGNRAPDDVKMINDNPKAGPQILAAD